MAESLAKGLAFTSGVNALKSIVDPADFARFVDALPPRTQALIASPPIATAWIPLVHMADVYDVGYRVACRNDLELMTEIGRRSTRANIKGPHKIFVRLLDPSFLMERSTRLWGTYYQNHGHIVVVSREKHRVLTRYVDMALGSDPFWASMRGSMLGLGEAMRLHGSSVTIVSGGGSSRDCEFESRWT